MKQISNEPVVRLRTVGLALTMQCNFECSHCITDSGPKRVESIEASEAFKLIDEIGSESESICFTGGESLLKKDLLISCIERARKNDLIPTLVTNGYWADEKETAKKILKELSDAGLSGICISLDRFHLPFVGQNNAIRIARISKEYGLNHVIRVCSILNDDFAEKLTGKDRLPCINYQKVRVVRLGRAMSFPSSLFKTASKLPGGHCSTVLSPIVLPNGTVQACCGPGVNFEEMNPLNLGNWKHESLGNILRKAKSSPFVMALNNIGPKGIVELAKKNGFGHLLRRRSEYTGICEVCIDICNSPEIASRLENSFNDPELKLKLIAGQVYQQSHIYLKKLGYLELPE